MTLQIFQFVLPKNKHIPFITIGQLSYSGKLMLMPIIIKYEIHILILPAVPVASLIAIQDPVKDHKGR